MRSVNFRDVILWPIFSRLGYDPTKDLFDDFADALARYINKWVRVCWDAADWPELSKIESRTPTNHLVSYDVTPEPAPDFVFGDSYNLDDVVREESTGDIYQSLQNANTGNALSDGAWWVKIDAWDPTVKYVANDKVSDPASGLVYIAKTVITPGSVLAESLQNPTAWTPEPSQKQPDETRTDIGKVLKVYLVDPRNNEGPFDTPFKLQDTAIHVGFDHGTTVFIKFMSRPSTYTCKPWDNGTSYVFGDVVYYPITGHCYRSVAAGANINHTPELTGAWWKVVPFPFVLAEPVWRGAFSDALRDDQQFSKAELEEKAAMTELQLSISRNLVSRYDQLTDQQTGVPRNVVEPVAGAM